MHFMKIESIADHLDLLDTLVKWHRDQWGSEWAEYVNRSTLRDQIPTIYVATEGSELLGSAMLVDEDMTTRKDLSPWLGGVYVKPSRRGQGIGTALVKHAMEQAAKMGIPLLWLYTPASRYMYERLGWQYVSEEDYLGEKVTIMRLNPQNASNVI
jgi:GNAT superfamily N-acetyltransferase